MALLIEPRALFPGVVDDVLEPGVRVGDRGDVAVEVGSGEVRPGELRGSDGGELGGSHGGGGGPPADPGGVGAVDAGFASVGVVEDRGEALAARIGDGFG